MPRAVKGTTEEREKFMAEVFREYYQQNGAAKDMSVAKANKKMVEKFGSMLRNRRAYEIRASVKKQVLHGNKEHTKAAREAGDLAPGSKRAAALVEGTPDQIVWLDGVLDQLSTVGLASAKIDHKTEAYAVVARR
jgi:hypothetical protein